MGHTLCDVTSLPRGKSWSHATWAISAAFAVHLGLRGDFACPLVARRGEGPHRVIVVHPGSCQVYADSLPVGHMPLGFPAWEALPHVDLPFWWGGVGKGAERCMWRHCALDEFACNLNVFTATAAADLSKL